MTDKQLEEMRDRAEWHKAQADDLRLVIMSENVLDLLNERASLVKIVQTVADGPHWAIDLYTLQQQARALLAGEGSAMKNWRVKLICCDRDDGEYLAETWDEADAFRESYTGAGLNERSTIDPHGYSGTGWGHKRAGIIERIDANKG